MRQELNVGRGRMDSPYVALRKEAERKGLKLVKNALSMGFCLTLPNNESVRFTSFSLLKNYIKDY